VQPITALRQAVMVRCGEGPLVLWSAAYFFMLLGGYYLLRPVRETMGIARGHDNLPWLMTGTLAAMLLVSPLFALLVSRLPRRRFIPITYRFFAANLVVFWVLLTVLPEDERVWLGYAFYIWLSVYNLFAVSIFWSIMSDLFTSEQGKRLFGLIGVGGTLGAICGAVLVRVLGGEAGLLGMELSIGPAGLMLLGVVPIELAVRCIGRLRGHAAMGAISQREPGPGAMEGLRLVARSPYLLMILVYVLLFAVLSTFLYLEQGRIIQETAASERERIDAFARIDMWANILTISLQLLLTGRIMSRLGVGVALGLLPLLSVAGFAWLLAAPSLGALVVFQVLRRGVNHAISRPAREVLYTVVSPDARYKSKSFIDTFVYRTGDMAGAWSPALLARVGVPVALAALPVAALSLGLGAALGVMHGRAARARSETAAAHPPRPELQR
jgi:ATP:ADP antiporter, AAA family